MDLMSTNLSNPILNLLIPVELHKEQIPELHYLLLKKSTSLIVF